MLHIARNLFKEIVLQINREAIDLTTVVEATGIRGTKPFRFSNHWMFKEGYRETVLSSWKKHKVTDLSTLHQQLFRVKHILKTHYVKKSEDVTGLYNEARDKFIAAQEALAINPLCPTTITTEKIDYARNIWNRMIVPKHRFIGWKIVNNQLLTRDNLSRFMPISSSLCPVYCRENESHQHLFVTCCFTRNLVDEITKWFGHIDWPIDFSCWFSKAAVNLQGRITNAVILATLYMVWTNRNSCIFELSCKTASTLSREIKSCVKYRCLIGCNGGKGKLDNHIFNLVLMADFGLQLVLHFPLWVPHVSPKPQRQLLGLRQRAPLKSRPSSRPRVCWPTYTKTSSPPQMVGVGRAYPAVVVDYVIGGSIHDSVERMKMHWKPQCRK
ncbi:hypothetical protein G4B88_008038 [Cannabis sativa]|uniref:Reverse transcriptase zinc-binding domain-containing protein n=1 Tax=Cannabis sativa TaxID=3483 RepID=A0A7J6I706_CANSA|nr:hypothetical protein G4B88_008038 [Cannabis sativa]